MSHSALACRAEGGGGPLSHSAAQRGLVAGRDLVATVTRDW